MLGLLNLLGRREVDAWRDHWSNAAAMVLNDLAASALRKFDADIARAGLADVLVGQRGFIARSVEPHLRAVTMPVVERIVADANEALREIANHHAIWHGRPTLVEAQDGGAEGLRDIAMTAAPIAAGAATAAALPAMAVTTSAAWFGLATVTAISWPVVIGGGALAAVALAVGGYRSGGVKDRARERLRKSVHRYVVETIVEGRPGHPAILQQVVQLLAETAREAKRHRR